MTDPVIDPDGNTYERVAIENWIKDHSTSPIVNLRNHLLLFFFLLQSIVSLFFKDSYSSDSL